MKAMSIIGMILSPILFVLSIVSIDASRKIDPEYGFGYYSNDMNNWGILMMAISLFFLAFSIVACVRAFKKKQTI